MSFVTTFLIVSLMLVIWAMNIDIFEAIQNKDIVLMTSFAMAVLSASFFLTVWLAFP